MSSLSEDEAQITAGSFEKLYASQIAENAINVGDIAPDFTLPNATGDPVTLYEALDSGPVVLSFYRGGWCPFCNLELQALQARLPEIRALGASLIGISPETPDMAQSAIEKHQLEFEVEFGKYYNVLKRVNVLDSKRTIYFLSNKVLNNE